MMQETNRFHYVPKFLLRPWLIKHNGQDNLMGLGRDYKNQVFIKRRGLDSFCNQLGLLTLKSRVKQQDVLETRFFQNVDSKGVKIRDLLIEGKIRSLKSEERCDFARLLMSLEARRPNTVSKLRQEISQKFIQEIDNDLELVAATKAHGVITKPSEWYEKYVQFSFEDRAVSLTQKLTDNPTTGKHIINLNWLVLNFDSNLNSLLLSDRPLIRTSGNQNPNTIWALPLAPYSCFFAASPQIILRVKNAKPSELIKKLNIASLQQAERYVFSIHVSHKKWCKKYLLVS